MIESVLEKLHIFFQRYGELFPHQPALLRATYKPIHVYASDANQRIKDAKNLLQTALDILQNTSVVLSEEASSALNVLRNTLVKKYKKIQILHERIPDGMLDMKRVLSLKEPLSLDTEEQTALSKELQNIRCFMRDCNTSFMKAVEQGGTLPELLSETSRIYWENVQKFIILSDTLHSMLTSSKKLSDTGEFALICLRTARLAPATQIMSHSTEYFEKTGFYENEAYKLCKNLDHKNKIFFHIPRNETFYHIDYEPKADLAGTGGDCFGQSLMFIESLRNGKMKWLCPEMGLVNLQLNQQKTGHLGKELLARTESSNPEIPLCWTDIKDLCIELEVDSLCGLSFAMNPNLAAQRSFSAGHICVLARLDEEKTPYKYLVYEKTLGAFGLPDEEALEQVMTQILARYRGMMYSQCKCTRYAKATEQTYEMLGRIPAINLGKSNPRQIPEQLSFFKKPVASESIATREKNCYLGQQYCFPRLGSHPLEN